ncbi:RluA family pseudouridine synthase [Candidatus Microgenomates bacterium]|nr:RluA family pseudouridine synthase [Candidatus Microgenomates bacterium]
MLDPTIIFEDESFFVVDKPTGWISNDASTTTTQPVIQTWVRENFDYPLKGDKEYRDGLVHRLDKETSGILLVAKTKQVFEALQGQFKERVVKKTYVALVHGKVEPQEGVVDQPVGRLPWRKDRFGVLPGGRDAVTNYKVVSNHTDKITNEQYSLLELTPKTGRTHQIRIHAKHIGHPLVSDTFYAGRKTARKDRMWCPRLFLHAQGISFVHPTSGESVFFKSKLPFDLKTSLQKREK